MLHVAEATQMSTVKRIWALFVLCFALSLVISSLTGLYPAAADLVADTGASQTELTWIVDAYTLAMGGLLLPAGALGDRFGRRGIMNIGLGLFALGSVVPLLVDSPTILIIARGFTGLAAACVMPSTLSLITSIFPREYRDQAVAVWAAVATLAGAFGILGSGALLEFFGWRSVFWLFLIMSVVAFGLAWTVPSSREPNPPPMDTWGAVTSGVAISAVVFGLIEGGTRGWGSAVVLLAFAVGLGSGALFVALQLRSRHPLLDVRLFMIRPFAAGALSIVMVFVTTFGMFFVTMQYMQFVLGYSALRAGLIITVMGLTILPLSAVAARLTTWLGLRVVTSVGCLCAAGTCVILYQADSDSGFMLLALAMLVFGGGIGLNVAPCTSAIIDNVSAEKQGVASAVNHTSREVGAALGIALLGSILTSGYSDRIKVATESLPAPARDASRESIGAALEVAAQSGPAGGPLAQAARDAFVHGFHNAMLITAILMVITAVLTLLWAPGPVPKTAASIAHPDTSEHDGIGYHVSGSVRMADGDPLPACVMVLVDRQGQFLGRTETDSRGRYRIPARQGEWLLTCLPENLPPQIDYVSVNDGPAVRDLVLHGVATLSGRASVGGRPVEGVAVSVIDADGDVLASTVTGEDGRYEIDELAGGSYAVTALSPHTAPAVTSVEVPSCGSAEYSPTLTELHGVVGIVRDAATGRPVPAARITLANSDGAPVASTTSGPDGRYRFDSVPAGRYSLETEVTTRTRVRADVSSHAERADAELTFVSTEPFRET